MTLFQILTRYVALGKIRVTRKLLNRVRRETGGECRLKPPEKRKRKHHGPRLLCCAALVAILIVPVCFVTGQTTAAAQSVDGATKTSSYSAAALFNQGNVYARDGKPGVAILNYERAQMLAPNDADIAANLHFVRTKSSLPDAPENWLIRSLTYARPNTMAWLGCFGLVLAGMGMVLVRLHAQHRVVSRSLAFVGVLLVASAIGSAVTTWPKMKKAVVVSHEAPARISPASVAEATFTLREGETVTVCAVHQGFALVQSPAGRSGWVARANIVRVVPQSDNPLQSSKGT